MKGIFSVLLLARYFTERFVREVVKREAKNFRLSVDLKEAIHGPKWNIKLCVTSSLKLPVKLSAAKPCPSVDCHMTSALFKLLVSMQHSAESAEKSTTRCMSSCIACASAGQQISLQQ